MTKLCRYCCYAARLIDRDKKKDAEEKLLFCSKIGMTVHSERKDCKYFQKPLPKAH